MAANFVGPERKSHAQPHPAMTSITRNFPWFIRDLGVSIVGKVRGNLIEYILELIVKKITEMLHLARRKSRYY